MFFRLSLIIVCLCCVSVGAKICKSMDIRTRTNETYEFQLDKLKNCTQIVGFLKFVLLESLTSYPSFPKLREVTGYVMVFRASYLISLGEIFPNLIVIRGNLLLEGHSLIIHHNDQLKKIGLPNLREIQRGYVHIGKCPNLCYVHTVNWTALGTSLSRFADVPKCEEEECAPDCNGHCWAPGKCQRHYDNCHPECLGCRKRDSPRECLVCRNMKDVDTCVRKCPSDKFISEETMTCVTEEECENMELPGDRWIFDKWCLPIKTCPEGYEIINTSSSTLTCRRCEGICVKICPGTVIESREGLNLLKDCTHIDGDLEFRLTNNYIIDQLDSLRSIQEIDGCLKVARSDALSSLNFLKNLRRIGGRDKHKRCNNYTVYIFQNPNLRTLFSVERIETSEDVGIGFQNNPELCMSEIQKFALTLGISKQKFDGILKDTKDISPFSNGDRAPCADINLNITILHHGPTNVTLKWEPYKIPNITVIGYALFYIPALMYDSNSNIMCNNNDGWMIHFISNNSIPLSKLRAYTTYVYWIKIDTMSGIAGSTEKKFFTTLPDDPSQPLSLEIRALSQTTINITWDAPISLNGNLSHYQLIAFVEKDDPKFITRRNYCLYPHAVSSLDNKVEIPEEKWFNQTENGRCVCEPNIFRLNDTFCGPSPLGLNYPNQDCNKYMYDVIENKSPKKKITKRDLLMGKSGPRVQPNETVIEKKIPANETNYILTNLKPFTTYIFLFSACNVEFRGKPQCSAVLFDSERTKPNISADRVTDLNLKILDDNFVSLTWKDPKNPNGGVVAYNVEYKSTDKSKSLYVPDCVTRSQHVRNSYVYKVQGMDPGLYTITVKMISLYGPGLYSAPVTFLIKSPLKIWVIYLFVCIVFVIVVVLVIIYLWYKRKKSFDNIHLITSINPDYQSAIYIEDEWEMNRDDIELNELIGQGTFGQVLNGYIKSKKQPCAVKTINKTASLSYKAEFLKEASVMKSFSGAHHVVKLFGVVSRGEPPLVIMELMERGDLKEYLRKSRESSQSISSPEMYQMAAQIADGMAYLAAKKFVHRDLAARNCMVAGDRTVKIGDFGMTKDIYETDYYRNGTKGLLPVRWMAPESLADGIFTSESDVWGYGIVLWEMVTLAEQPYQGMSNDQVLSFVISRGRLGRPLECPDVLWEIMEVCWRHRPEDRPLFMGIVEKMAPLAGPSFALVSFYHSPQGCEYRLNYRQDKIINASTSNEDPYQQHSSLSEEDDRLMPQDEDFYPSNTRAFKRRSLLPSLSWQSSYSISNPTP